MVWGTITDWAADFLDATIDPATTTGSSTDLCSFTNWPSQLNEARDELLAANPGAVLDRRLMGCGPGFSINTLIFVRPDRAVVSRTIVGGPELPAPWETCTPSATNLLMLGVSADNPATPLDEGGILQQVCNAPGTYTVPDSFDRVDTPPGDPVIRTDTASCSPNTPAGSSVSVPLNGGTTLRGGIDLTFPEVATGGSTTVVTSTTGPAPPTGYKIVGLSEIPLYFDLNTDVSYSGNLTVCIKYDETQVTGPEASLKLLHDAGEGYVDITTSVDAANDIVCGNTTHLSTFVVAERVATATPTPAPSPTPRPTATRPVGVGGTVRLPPAAFAAESAAPARDFGWTVWTCAAFAGGAMLLAAGGWYATRRWRES